MPVQMPGTIRPRVLVDTNVWRYLIDLDELETVYRAASGAQGVVLACPAVLYEMLRLEDVPLRHRLIKAICRSRRVRMMPEAFEESMEFKTEISRLRPHWLLGPSDLSYFRSLYNDWNGPRGVWWRARVDPSRAAAILNAVEGSELTRGRGESQELRTQIAEITTFDKVKLGRWTSTFSQKIDGWDGNPVEAWRAETMMFYIDALLRPVSGQSSATREWLEPLLDLAAMRRESASFVQFFLYQTDASHLARNWLRWAFRTLQATRKTSPGTPVDNQIGSYLVDADFLITADKVFASIAQRVAAEKVIPIARPVLVTVDNCVSNLIDLIV